ncbi:hypothetical protein KAFR_0E00410 [Kazachstania africana CBS 2517]|uniref:Uncharacterized protein n=1 Tax=Kazachstania africana (strain ATCC 22294 / BCRC 22015 / CBS 2517 / CECT 1963 / NBRC 1671 / NRRL Y-8276) TaxID=1071382 RepID=H2AUZ5_KAZAF|nr:hypothetical protein KAFR_0E00410 [Kazachstania africana CBS 2517]CCF58195.1 hypothetical protein KAFR_0E00410 [Kazachstania africana CBS 2517]
MWGYLLFNNEWKYPINGKKFDELDLSLYRSAKRKTVIKYIVIIWCQWFLQLTLFLSDVYTCIKLIAFNTWSNNYVKPFLSFKITRWLFSGCILFSIVLLIWELINGIKILKTQNISFAYINTCSKTIYCLTNYSIYCIFDKITPSGVFQRLAFFIYFELKSSFRLLFADSPRQVINGLTLWSILLADSNWSSQANGTSSLNGLDSIHGIIKRFKTIAENNSEEAIILACMTVSFFIWFLFIVKFFFAIFCCFIIYYKLLHEFKFSSLKEYVCITISYNIDYLTEKYKFKKFYMEVNTLANEKYHGNFEDDYEETDESFMYDTSHFDDEMIRSSLVKTPDTIPSYYYDNEHALKTSNTDMMLWEYLKPRRNNTLTTS